jgi:hypothetical protein
VAEKDDDFKIEFTPVRLKGMRERYGHECSVCGGQLTMQDSRDLVFACSPWEDDPEKPGYLRVKQDRAGVDEHYGLSRR